MRRLDRLDFVAAAPTPVLGWSLTAVSAVALAYVATQLWMLHSDERSLDRRPASSETVIRSARAQPQQALERAQAVAAHPTVTLQWSELLAAFDEHANPRIGLVKFEPDTRGRLRVTARARDPQTVVAFLRELEADARLKDVALVQQVMDPSATDRPVLFTMLAGWRGGEFAPSRVVILWPCPAGRDRMHDRDCTRDPQQ